MLKFIRGKGQQPSAERQKLQKELFAFRKTVTHGFPSKPTALAWDPKLRLLAIATASGALKVVGRPGVEFSGQHPGDGAITRLAFLPGQARLVTLRDDNSLHLWEVNDLELQHVSQITLEGKLKRVSALAVQSSCQHVLLGTEGGNVYLLHVPTFQLSETIIYQDVVMQKVPEDYKVSPGAVEGVAERPGHPGQLLIGYSRGLTALWDPALPGATATYVSSQALESLCWLDAQRFACAHNDGSYSQWEVGAEADKAEPTTPYGPFPCKAITKLLWLGAAQGQPEDDWLVFCGGMPRASYADRSTVTVQHGEKHSVLDFTSRVIDFALVQTESGLPDVLFVLAEEELVAVDLSTNEWRPLQLPYLVSLHASAVTCSQHVSDVAQQVWDALEAAAAEQSIALYAHRPWPVDGGEAGPAADPPRRDVLLTGHEDGSVRAWDAGGPTLRPMARFHTAPLFTNEDRDNADREEDVDEWPPFVKMGAFDPYSDDPRLAVKKTALCGRTGTLLVAGTAGSVVVATLGAEPVERVVPATSVSVVQDRDGFVWKGHDQLTAKTSTLSLARGWQACGVVQLLPPAAVTALALRAEWGVAAAGTAHGLALVDFRKHKAVAARCTLNPHDLSGAGEAPISRRKSFKKSLRESFRRLRKGRSQRAATVVKPASPVASAAAATTDAKRTGEAGLEARPVERSVEARPVDDGLGSMVRCLHFAQTHLLSAVTTSPTLWAGTNAGSVLVFSLVVPAGRLVADGDAAEGDVACQLAKEIQLKHRAPVVDLAVLDSSPPGVHRVAIGSEEQIKLFSLPHLRPLVKLKLTAQEGARVRRLALATFTAPGHAETCLACLTNLGEVAVLSLPELRRQLHAPVVRREDINGISSLCFTARGEALYLHSSSELQRVSLAVAAITTPNGHLSLADNARAKPKGEEPEELEPMAAKDEGEAQEGDQEDNEEKEKEDKDDDKDEDEDEEEAEEEPKVNGVDHDSPEPGEKAVMDLSQSVGDITIDSVRDHLILDQSGKGDALGAAPVVKATPTPSSTTEQAVVIGSHGDDASPDDAAEASSRRAPLATVEDA